MGYQSKNNRRPFEGASKASHHYIINDSEVQEVMKRIYQPPQANEIPLTNLIANLAPLEKNPVEAIIATDGGYTEVVIDKGFPSRTVHFLQFGALFLNWKTLPR